MCLRMIDRNYLDKILQQNADKNWWHPVLFTKNVKHLIPDSLEIMINPPTADKNYNCFMYALGLYKNDKIRTEAKGFIYDTMFTKILECHELQVIKDPEEGDYVIYRDKNSPDILTHIGICSGEKIISKWSWGPLVKHDLWDVPESYGDEVFYVKSISLQNAEELYSQYKLSNKLPEDK